MLVIVHLFHILLVRILFDHFSDEQVKRYEAYRRSGFSKAAMRRILHLGLGHALNPNTVIVVAGIAKVFVGQLVEKGGF